ncbi:hypothetical protein I3843_10G153900 [Carya illinoinensis]|nr:hypothetical protein I3760_10G162000 [Carya illinoinensis]KAG7960948.1 hypothetical protein I3843_10G153900 [Carya illinoinensis]
MSENMAAAACNNCVESSLILESNLEPEMQINKAIVEELYKALSQGQTETVAGLLASDLEWWFHGPPKCQHMMRVLTGVSCCNEFTFEPRSISAIGDDCVIVEGWEGAQAYWVHVWSLKDGLITQFREYFNTWLTVKDMRPWEFGHEINDSTLWQSQPRDLYERSLPGLMLAI